MILLSESIRIYHQILSRLYLSHLLPSQKLGKIKTAAKKFGVEMTPTSASGLAKKGPAKKAAKKAAKKTTKK